MIYFIQNTRTESVKIGVSKDPAGRILTLRTACADELMLLGAIPGGIEGERMLHKLLNKYRLEGEWFRGTGKVMEAVCLVLGGHPGVNLWDECKRRNKCRYGLRGVDVRVNGWEGIETIKGSGWGEHQALKIYLDDGSPPPKPPEGRRWMTIADIKPTPPGLIVKAEDCTLATAWPIACCWPDVPEVEIEEYDLADVITDWAMSDE